MTGSAGGKANRTRRGSKNPRPVSGAGSSSPGVLFHPNADEANSPLFRNRFSQIKFGLNPSSPKKATFAGSHSLPAENIRAAW